MYRLLLSLAVAVLLMGVAHAQEGAKAQLEKSPRHGEWVKVRQGKREDFPLASGDRLEVPRRAF